MTVSYLGYDLVEGYIHNWLVAGPLATAVPDPEACQSEEGQRELIRQHFWSESGVDQLPLENGVFHTAGVETTWSYYRCQEDHLVDFICPHAACQYLRTWAYTRLASPVAQEVTFVLTTTGQADVWLNGEHIQRHEHFGPSPLSIRFRARLSVGHNEILVRSEQVAIPRQATSMALRVAPPFQAPPKRAAVWIPTPITDVERRQAFESMFGEMRADRAVFVWDNEIIVRAPETLTLPANPTVRLQSPAGSIYFESYKMGPGKSHEASLGHAYEVPEGRLDAFLMPEPQEYYTGNMHYHHKVGFWVASGSFSETPYNTYEERRHEALLSAASRGHGLLSEVAKMALGQWPSVETQTILDAIEGVLRCEEASACSLMVLLGMMSRYGKNEAFPVGLAGAIERCALGFAYRSPSMGAQSEDLDIVVLTCAILAGQWYPTGAFADGHSGTSLRERAEQQALAWMHARGATGFPAWDAQDVFEQDLAALSHLADLATTTQVYDLAAVIMDKMLFSMAVNSFRGVFGSSHGSTWNSMITGGSLEATSGIARLVWGMGAFNHHLLGTVSLACATDYDVPTHIPAIAMDTTDEMWNRERHGAGPTRGASCAPAAQVNKVTYKTPDYMLCSAQDYCPGRKGGQEHIWQATLGRDAVVFVNHPACASIEDARRPSFWCGNGMLPRVAQWKSTLMALHNLPDDDWMGYTHAFFPTYAFDEYVLRQGWAFARKGDGYLALTSSAGFALVERGESAYRELRSYGQQSTWLCHMGRALLEGDFAAFQSKVLALDTKLEPLAVHCSTLRGEALAFDWHGSLIRNGEVEAMNGYMHYENPYSVVEFPASVMDIRYSDYLLKLHFTPQS